MDTNSIAHTTRECKYHIVFAPKFRRKVIYGELRKDIGQILRMLCERKGVELIEGECCPDHVHLFVRIPPKIAVSDFVGYLKGKSSLMITGGVMIISTLLCFFTQKKPGAREMISVASAFIGMLILMLIP